MQIALADATRGVVLAAGGRSIPSKNFHVTLAFLGSVPEARLSEVMMIGAAVAAEVEPISIQVDLQILEYWKKAQVLCVAAPESSAAHRCGGAALADRLKSKLSAAGFASDTQPFRAHVTLARKVAHPTRKDALRPAAIWKFTEFVLVESRTEERGSVYDVVESFPFAVS